MDSVFIIAEAGVNHNGSISMAHKLIEVAASAGIDAVKFQTFKAASLVRKGASKAAYQKQATEQSEDQLEMLKKLELTPEAHIELREHCLKVGIEFMSTPFDSESLKFLVETVGIKRVKIPSGEITNGPFLWEVGKTGLPAILSTGMSTLSEIEVAIGILGLAYSGTPLAECSPVNGNLALRDEKIKTRLKEKLCLLHCTTEYPAPLADVHLKVMSTLRDSFGLATGYSDHTQGISISIAAAALGAKIVEKHFTLDRGLSGPDHAASIEPDELKQMVSAIREVEIALGSGEKRVTPSEQKNISVVRKSLVAKKTISAGTVFTSDNVVAKRPADGLSPMLFWEILGKEAPCNFDTDEKIRL